MSIKINILQIMPAINWWAEFQEKDGVIFYVPVAFFALRKCTNRQLDEFGHVFYEEIFEDCVPVLMGTDGSIDMLNTDSIAGLNRYFYDPNDPRDPEYVIGMIE